MIVKIATYFLIGMAILALFGRLRFPGIGRGRAGALPRPKRCKRCGRINVTGGACDTCDGPDSTS